MESLCNVIVAREQKDILNNLSVRYEVFVVGQGIPYEDELDGLDEVATLFVVYDEFGKAIGASRLRIINNSFAKFERIAVTKIARGKGVGKRLMQEMINYVKEFTSIDLVKLSSQEQVIKFYENLGFITEGEMFVECGIKHINMKLYI